MKINAVQDQAFTPAVLEGYEDLLGRLGKDGFEPTIERWLGRFAPSGRFYVFEGDYSGANILRMARYEPSIRSYVPDYLRSYVHTDPISKAVAAARGQGKVVVMRVAPGDIDQAGYRERFFTQSGIVERVSVVQGCGGGRWRALNISRRRRDGVCSDTELGLLAEFGQLLLPMVSAHVRALTARGCSLSVQDLEARFAQLHPTLTGRERQVCARAAAGMGVEATALDLGVALTSILTYRRRAYARLQISSPYELARMVMH